MASEKSGDDTLMMFFGLCLLGIGLIVSLSLIVGPAKFDNSVKYQPPRSGYAEKRLMYEGFSQEESEAMSRVISNFDRTQK
jgi:hypothetical protein